MGWHSWKGFFFKSSTMGVGPPPSAPPKARPHIAAPLHHIMKLLYLHPLAVADPEVSSKCSLAFLFCCTADIITAACWWECPLLSTTLLAVWEFLLEQQQSNVCLSMLDSFLSENWEKKTTNWKWTASNCLHILERKVKVHMRLEANACTWCVFGRWQTWVICSRWMSEIWHLPDMFNISYHGNTTSLKQSPFSPKWLWVLFKIATWKMNNLLQIQHNHTECGHYVLVVLQNNNPSWQSPSYKQWINKNMNHQAGS